MRLRVGKIAQHLSERRGAVGLRPADHRRHVGHRDVEGLIERAARPLADDEMCAPVAVHLHVGNFRRAVDEVVERSHRLAVAKRSELRQEVQRNEPPHLDTESRVDGFEDAVIGPDPHDGPSLLVVRRKPRIVAVGGRIERRGVHDGRAWSRRSPRAASARTSLITASASATVRFISGASVGHVRCVERNHRPGRRRGVQISLRVVGLLRTAGAGHARNPEPRAVGHELVPGWLGSVHNRLIRAERAQPAVESRHRQPGRQHQVRALRNLDV